jgi:protoporphyrinogen/coproporphyrinogen III oxidase
MGNVIWIIGIWLRWQAFHVNEIDMPPSHIGILGGGLTGLSSAYHLSRKFPSSLITLLEKQPRFGGWVRSERVQVKDEQGHSASVVLEAGPRTLRPNAKSILELVSRTSCNYL